MPEEYPYAGERPGSSSPGSSGHSDPSRKGEGIHVTADWTVPHRGPSGPVTPANYSMVSSFDIDWLTTPGFQMLLDNLAASPGAFTTMRVMKVLSSGTPELGPAVTGSPPPADTVWPYVAAPGVPGTPSFAATLAGLEALTTRGLTPYVVLGFFPQGVYSGTSGGLPAQNSPYGPDPDYLDANPGDWEIILGNWKTLIRAFFQALGQFGTAINDWWFEVWNEPDNGDTWLPDTAGPTGGVPLPFYLQLYQATVTAIAAAELAAGVKVRVGGPAIMANNEALGDQTDLQIVLPSFLDFVYYGGAQTAQDPPLPSLQCDFISLHAKGDWTEQELPDLSQTAADDLGVIHTMESTVSQFTSQAKYDGHFDGIWIVNNEADMRVGVGIPFYPRMTSQYPAWLTALMIASDSLTSQYASHGVQFVNASDNVHPELVGWEQATQAVSGQISFGQQRSLMTAASSWQAGTADAPECPQDLLKVPVYNFYELLRLLGDQHGAFVSGQQNFYPTDPTSDLFSAITVGAPSGKLTHVCWVFCVYPTTVPTTGPLAPAGFTSKVAVIDLPASWTRVNWVQFQIGPAGTKTLVEDDSFTVAETDTGQPETQGETGPILGGGGAWRYYFYDQDNPMNRTALDLTNGDFAPANIRKHQEVGLVQYMKDVPVQAGTWESPNSIDFEPYSATVFWITPHTTDPAATPIAPQQLSSAVVGGNVVLTWRYAPIESGADRSSPLYYSFFYFEVLRDETTISPIPALTTADDPSWSFALRATMWVDTGAAQEAGASYTYSVRAWNASGVSGPAASLMVSI